MCSKIQGSNVSKLVGYTYPKLHKGKEWYVDFYALDPATNTMRRKKYSISTELRVAERNRRATEIINVVSSQLMKGWNPWVQTDNSRAYVLFDDCLQRYLDFVDRMDRKKTRQSYHSRVNVLKEYIATRVTPLKYAYQFDESFCNDFIDWIYLDRESSPRTRNNYRGWLFGFSEFMVARKYINNNPVEKIKVMSETEKFRKDLTPEMLKTMTNYLAEHDKSFLLACLMQYYTLIRPGELSNLKIGDISLRKQTIFVSKAFSKNRRDDNVGLNKIIIKLMLDLNIFQHTSDCYIFSHDFKPGKEHVGSDQFNKRWKVMRNALKWSDCYQFYSLKDSGIRDLASSEGVVVARDQARHRDISTTNRYIQHHDVQPGTLNFEGNMVYGKPKEKEDKEENKDKKSGEKNSKDK